MFDLDTDDAQPSPEDLLQQAEALMSVTRDPIANAANLSSLLFHSLESVNWVGFYLEKNGELVVGPFNGKPACVTIPIGKGVCGTAAATRQTQLVADVHAFDGHIACDVASRSEIVIPVIQGEKLLGVLDIDSPKTDRFDEEDQVMLENIVESYVRSIS